MNEELMYAIGDGNMMAASSTFNRTVRLRVYVSFIAYVNTQVYVNMIEPVKLFGSLARTNHHGPESSTNGVELDRFKVMLKFEAPLLMFRKYVLSKNRSDSRIPKKVVRHITILGAIRNLSSLRLITNKKTINFDPRSNSDSARSSYHGPTNRTEMKVGREMTTVATKFK
jgi:hypothetical protein